LLRKVVSVMLTVLLLLSMPAFFNMQLYVKADPLEIIIDTELGESRFTTSPPRQSPYYWVHVQDHDTFRTRAYAGNFWYTLCGAEGTGEPLYFGTWYQSLSQSGVYEVFVWIPNPDPFEYGGRVYTPTQSAIYQIYHKYGMTTRTVNQRLRTGGWYSLGTYTFDTSLYVILNDRTGEPYLSTMIAFDAIKFVQVNNPPYTPSNPSPSNHATGVSIYADLSWSGGDPDVGDTVTYDVYFGVSSSPPLVSSGQSASTYDPGTLSYSTTYYWKIVAKDNHGASTVGPVWDFTTQSAPPEYRTLTVYSSPSGVTFTVDGVSRATPWSATYSQGTSVSLVMPSTHSVGEARYYWDRWSDGVTSRSRTVTMNTDITLTAYFTGPYYQLTVTSSPITGIPFTINGVSKTTSYTEWLLQGSYTIEMPATYSGYTWSYWLEDGDTNRIKTFTLSSTRTWTAVYTTPAPPDSTPPTTPIVTDDGKYTSSTTWLHATWSSSDPESGITEYQYAIGTSSGGTDVVDWTSVGTATGVTKTGLSLTQGTTYYFAVKAKNGQGLWSEVGTSDGITVIDDPLNWQGNYLLDESKLRSEEKRALPYVLKWAAEYNVSPALLMAIIRQESDFNPKKVGDVELTYPAYGYMQVRWPAAKDAGYLGTPEQWKTDGLDPDKNIMYGAKYLKERYKKFPPYYATDLENALSAYQGGYPRSDNEWYVNQVIQGRDLIDGKRRGYLFFLTMYIPSPEIRWEVTKLCSPGELRAYDSEGRVTGLVNGEIRNEIPYSDCYENTITIISLFDSYRYQVVGTGEGLYSLTIVSATKQENITFATIDIPTSVEAIHQYTLDWTALSMGEEGVTVQVDSNGDGMFEYIFTSDIELTQSEFLTQTAIPVLYIFSVVWGEETFVVSVESNSTVSNFAFNQPSKEISFNVTGLAGTIGICNVAIPKVLLYGEPWTVLIDGASVLPTITENATHCSLYFTYAHSTHLIQIIGTWVIAPPPPTYNLTIITTVGGTTDPAPGTYSYTANSSVQVTAIPNADYVFDHWELDTVNVGSANPYTVLMDNNHTLKAVFAYLPPPPSLSASISPLSASMLVGQSVTFTSTVSGGYTPYTYQWYLNGNPVSGATSNTWTFTPTSSGIYYVHLKVTDAKGNTAQSETARVSVATVPVGGYSVPIDRYIIAKPVMLYFASVAILSTAFAVIRRKAHRKTK
jgi:hypothetical protein